MINKFTNMSGAKVGKEPDLPKPTNEEIEEADFKNKVMKLLDDLLSIRSYGSARPEIMIPTTITGKELFVEALSDLVNSNSKRKVVKTLESLKFTNRDWKSIDDKILELKSAQRDIKEEKKILNILDKWQDEESLKIFFETHKISKNDAIKRCKSIENLVEKVNNPMLEVLYKHYQSLI